MTSSAVLLKTATHSAEETEAVGAHLAEMMLNDSSLPAFVALYGDLGAGKTAFVRGFASVISPGSAVRSPTFTLVNEYKRGKRPIFHFDMYRINNDDELYSVGFYDYEDRGGICLAEWCEKIPWALPDDRISVTVHRAENENDRSITVERIVRKGQTK